MLNLPKAVLPDKFGYMVHCVASDLQPLYLGWCKQFISFISSKYFLTRP